ncbi:hypothetical protein GOP47_0016376 [Adiantum capillus-veneris]|uniref:C2H2-type domain-containing protein n=1 Tax=Adiantum capillus-veneris TaxID=13818 RepID=A0A9D4UHJ5_ADICA|nr:hypothetical protein GOP47_0016376 [Adiantum capillus-veneris]
MLPQQGPYYPAAVAAGAPSVYGQPGFYSPPNQSLIVPVGIPAGVAPVYGAVAHGGNVVPAGTLVHVGNVGNIVPAVAQAHMGNSVMGNTHVGSFPAQSLHASNSFIQAQQSCLIQTSGSNNIYESSSNTDLPGHWQGHRRCPCSPPPSSFPPGFEPRHSNNVAMGIPSQPTVDNFATGGMAMHANQHQRPFQQQHQQQSQLEFEHQQHSCPQPPHQQQHQSGQQPPHSHQHSQSQSSHSLYHQHRQQNFHSGQHQHQNQHQLQFQHQHYSQQHQHQQHHTVQQRLQYEHQQYQHSHSQPQPVMQTQPQNLHQSNSHAQLQLQPQPQLLPTVHQMQPLMQMHQPNFHTNGVAIGLPVMPTHSSVDGTSAQSRVQSQQSTPAWQQPAHLENLSSTLQLLKSNGSDKAPLLAVSQGEIYENGQHSTNIHRAGEPHTKGSFEQAQSMSSLMPKAHPGLEVTRAADSPRIDHARINGHMASVTARPSSTIESNHRNWLSPSQAQLQAGSGAGSISRASRDYQPHSNKQFKSQSNRSFPTFREKFGDFRGKPFGKGLGKRSDMQPLKCEPCDRTFTTSEVLADHLKSHVKCGEEGCLFEAAGKIVKEHKVVEHGKVEFQSTYRGRKALALRSMEDKEDIKRWREERKRSYPTSGNILRKAEKKRERESEGELFDEEAQQRRQRMLDVIAKQKQLGYQVPEIPSHYFRTQNRQSKKSRQDDNARSTTAQEKNSIRLDDNARPAITQEGNSIVDGSNGKSGIKEAGDVSSIGMQNREGSPHEKKNDDDNQYHRNGHFKKGHRNKFSSWQDRRKLHQDSHPPFARWQRPSLLSQLLIKDIEAENSQLLQCCRFIVNNAFLKDCALTSMKHFEWIEAALGPNGSDPLVDVMDPKVQLKLEVGEEASTSDHSPCGEESYQASDSKNLITVTQEVISNIMNESITNKDVISCDDVPGVSPRKRKGNEEQNTVQPGRDSHDSCLPKGSGKTECNTLQMCSKGLPDALVELNHAASEDIIGDVQASWKPRITEFLSQDLEAGEAASGNSESVVEDEEDISQYMNLDGISLWGLSGWHAGFPQLMEQRSELHCQHLGAKFSQPKDLLTCFLHPLQGNYINYGRFQRLPTLKTLPLLLLPGCKGNKHSTSTSLNPYGCVFSQWRSARLRLASVGLVFGIKQGMCMYD